MYINTEIQDAVEIITIDRQKALNALNKASGQADGGFC